MRYVRLLFALALPACSGGGADPALTRGPQVAQVQPTGAVVAFLTRTAVVAQVEYGPGYAASAVDAGPTREHVFALSGLVPDAEYPYRILIGEEVVSEGHAFRTAPSAPDAPLRFAALGDSGSGSVEQADLAALLGTLSPDLVLHTGDAVYELGAPHELDRGYFLPYRDLIDDIPFYVALGNHDTYWDDGQTLLDNLYLPVNDADLTEHFYSFDVGPVHCVALDSNRDLAPESVQGDWLAADLAAHAGSPWTWVFFHHALYSSGPRGNDAARIASLAPLFEQHGVDLVLNGHEHIYHRTYPLVDGAVVDAEEEPDYVDPSGPIYVVTGGGGRSLYPVTPQSITAFTESVYHVVVIDVLGASLTLRAIRRDGTEMDRITITRTP